MNIYDYDTTFLSNKYTKWYDYIIKNALQENRKKYKGILYEKHHILPKSIFPEYKNLRNNPWNKVLLTSREHFICHWLLTKICKNKRHKKQMQHALHKMSFGTKRTLPSRYYEIARKHQSESVSGSNNPMFGTTRPAYVIEAIKKAHTGTTNISLSTRNLKSKWWTNGEIDCFREDCPPNFYAGRSGIKGSKNPGKNAKKFYDKML